MQALALMGALALLVAWASVPRNQAQDQLTTSQDGSDGRIAIDGARESGGNVESAVGLAADRPVAIESVGRRGDRLVVRGHVRSDAPVEVEVMAGEAATAVVADQPRPDLLAVMGFAHHSFEVELDTDDVSQVCIETSSGADCAPVDCVDDMFDADFVDRLRRRYPDQRIVASVVDTRTGCTYDLRAGLPITTASVMKLEVLGAVLLQAQTEGRPLTVAEQSNVEAMLHLSLNPETAVLWQQVGLGGLESFSASVGATNTRHTPVFGATVSTAADRTQVALAVLAGDGPLEWSAVERAWGILAGVHPSQQWGISAGVAEGFSVVNKNGFYPLTGAGWRVGSTGFVLDPDGGGYAITVMTDRNPDQAEGIDIVERVGRHVARRLTSGPVASRPFDDAACILHEAGETWVELAVRLGLAPIAADDVRRTAGGDGPLRGQVVCAP